MADIDYSKYVNKKAYNNLPIPEGQYLAPFLIESYDEVKQNNYCRENLETWHFSGVGVLVGFVPVTEAQFAFTMKFFWNSVRSYIAELGDDPNVISYDKFLDDMNEEGSRGYEPASTPSSADAILLGLIIDDLIREVTQLNPRYGHILELIKEEYSKGEIVVMILKEYGLKKTQAYSEIKAAQKLAKELYEAD